MTPNAVTTSTVQEYDLDFHDVSGPVSVQMPAQGIVGVRLKGEPPAETLKIFTIADSTVGITTRSFQLFFTGEPLIPYKKFIGTFKMTVAGADVFRHLFEV